MVRTSSRGSDGVRSTGYIRSNKPSGKWTLDLSVICSCTDAVYRRCRRPRRSVRRHVTCPAGSPLCSTVPRTRTTTTSTFAVVSCRRRSSVRRSGLRSSRRTCSTRRFVVRTLTSRTSSTATVSAGSLDTTEVRRITCSNAYVFNIP